MIIMIDKKEARRLCLKKRSLLTDDEVSYMSRVICEKIINLEIYKSAGDIMAYYRLGKEIDLSVLFEEAFKDEKNVFLPRVNGREMDFYPYTGEGSIRSGFKGIMEPVSEEAYIPQVDKEILMIMPGAAFDKKLGRAGYGGGFYDRYLERFRGHRIYRIAAAYDFQVLDDEIALDAYDIKPDMIITKDNIYTFST